MNTRYPLVRKLRYHAAVALATSIATLLASSIVEAANTQTTFTAGTDLLTAGNWNNGLPSGTKDAIFDIGYPTTTATFTMSTTNLTMGSLDVLSNQVITISNKTTGSTSTTLTLGSSSTSNSVVGAATNDLIYLGGTSSNLTIKGPNDSTGTGVLNITLGFSGNFDVANSGATLTISAIIGGQQNLTKTGAGMLILSGNNTFGSTSNSFTISSGTVQMSGSGTLGSKFNDLNANGGTLDLNGTSQTVDALNGAGSILNNGGGTSVLTIGSDASGGTFTGTISDHTSGTGIVALNKIGNGTATINGAQTYSGDTTVSLGYLGAATPGVGAGALSLGNSSGRLTNSNVIVNGATFSMTDSAAGTVTRANGVTLNNATMNVTGNSAGNTVNNIANALTLGAGRSTMTLTPSSSRNLQFTAASLARNTGATVLVRGTNFGANTIASATINSSNISFATAPTLSGSGAAGTTTVGIIPWAYGDNSVTGVGTDFLTYDAANGLRRLTSSEYVTTLASGNSTLHNVKLTNTLVNLEAATSINSLVLGTASRINGAGTLSVASGGILATDNASIGTLSAGTVDFGAAEGILNAVSGKALTVASAITGSGGVTAGGAGTVVLTGANSYTGGTSVSGGVLNINGDAALGTAPVSAANNIFINGGTLQAGASNVTLGSTRNIVTGTSAVNAVFDTAGNTMTVNGVISGAGNVYKAGNGTLNLTAVNIHTGATYVTGGAMNVTGSLANTSSLVLINGSAKLDFNGANAPASNIVNSSAQLIFNNGAALVAGVNNLTIQGKNGATSTQTFSSTNLGNFASHLTLTPGTGGTLTVNLGNFARNTLARNDSTSSNPVGATLDIVMPASGVTLNYTGTISTVNAVIPGTTVNGTTWAITGAGSTIIGLADASYSSSYSTANVNLDVKTDGNTLTADAGSLRFNTNTGGTITLTLGGTNNGLRALQGGLLVTSNVGANNVIVTGGMLQGLGRRDSVFIQNNTQGYLQIDSILTDLNGSGAQGITKSGAGTMILTANNTIGGPAVINEGTIIVTGSAAAGVTKTGTINAGTLNQVTFSDVTGLFVGQKVTQSTVLNNSGGTTWVVVAIDSLNNIVTLSSNASGALPSGSFVFSGAGGLGATTTANSIAAGATLQLGNGGTTGSLFAGQGIVDNGLLLFNRSNAYIYGAVGGENISGTGAVTQAGSSTVTLSGSNTYTGATTVNSGATLIAGSITAFGTNSAATIASGGLMQLNGKTISLGSLAGGGIVENANAASIPLTLGGNNANADFSGTLRDGTGGGSLSLIKNGTGTQTLSGTNTSTGTLTVNAGAVNISGSFGATITVNGGAVNISGSSTGLININGGVANITGSSGGVINVANTASGSATLKIGPGAVVTSHVTSLVPSIGIGSTSGSAGAVYQTGGSVTFDGQLVFGPGGGNASGFYSLSGGSIIDTAVTPANERFRIAGSVNNSTGVFYQSGGSVTLLGGGPAFEVGGNGGGPVTNSTGIAYHTGGTMTINTASHIGYDSSTGQLRGEQTIAGTAQVTINGTTTIGQSALDVGILNLDGGTYAVKQIVKGSQGQGYVNFNGGILKAATAANSGSFLTGLTAVNIYGGGATIDTSGQNITIGQALLAPAGSGVTTIPVTNGGAGYVGAPVVSITGGGGSGATAVANMIDDGTGNGTFKIDSITITNAGTNYTSTPTVSVIGGGGLGVIFGAVTTATNTSGGLIKTGLGTLTLSNNGSTYSGETDVNQGTLLVTGSISGSMTKVNGTGTLGGTGTVGAVDVTSGGTLSPGTSGLGTLTSSGGVTLESGATFKLEINTTTGLGDVLNSSGAFSLALSNDVQLSISDLAPGSSANSYVFLNYTPNTWNGGLFTYNGNVIPDGGSITVGSNSYTLDYDLNGNSVALLAIPEAGSAVSLCGGLGVLLGVRRMRRRR